MKRLLLFILLLMFPAISSAQIDKETATGKAKAMVKELGYGLKGELVKAMKEGGPAQAIAVCKSVGQAKAEEVSEKHAAMIHRVSLKLRNPENRPDEYETYILEKMETDHAGGGLKPAYSAVILVEGKKHLRFMKPIVTNQVCMNCHGSTDSIKPSVMEVLKREYPDDKATGYTPDQVRGAFSITYPME